MSLTSKNRYFFKHPKIITNFSITINNSTIEQVDHFNFLGVTLDQNITWDPHVDKLTMEIYPVTVLANRPYISHTTPIFKELRILKITDLYHVQLYKLHYNNINNLLPGYFRIFVQFLTIYGDHNYDFRKRIIQTPNDQNDNFLFNQLNTNI